MIKYVILMTYFVFNSLISSLNANQSDYMTNEEFSF